MVKGITLRGRHSNIVSRLLHTHYSKHKLISYYADSGMPTYFVVLISPERKVVCVKATLCFGKWYLAEHNR